jgi:peptide/nickel transport system permease protein
MDTADRIPPTRSWPSWLPLLPSLVTATVLGVCVLASLFAGWVAPHDPFDLATLNLLDARLPPVWAEGGSRNFLLGTDDQGRDILSALLYGLRISLVVGFVAVAVSACAGVAIGLLAGFVGGWVDALLMRLCDVMLTFPAILVALLFDGVGRALWPDAHDTLAFGVLIAAIALTGWVPYARTVRALVAVERHKDYVLAARLAGASPLRIMRRHVLPNVLGSVLVLATLQVASAILIEATLSFLGVGVPPTSPSLGTLIRIGNDFLFSGEWWIVVFPGLTLALVALCINVLGDRLRDLLDPRLR